MNLGNNLNVIIIPIYFYNLLFHTSTTYQQLVHKLKFIDKKFKQIESELNRT